VTNRRRLEREVKYQFDLLYDAWNALFVVNRTETEIAALSSEHAFHPPEALDDLVRGILHEGFQHILGETNAAAAKGNFDDKPDKEEAFYSALLSGMELYARMSAVRMFFIGQYLIRDLPADALVQNRVYWVTDEGLEDLLAGRVPPMEEGGE
jgi:hypothetical protein